MALDEVMERFRHQQQAEFTKASVNAWRGSLEKRKLGSSSIMVRLAAIRKLAMEAVDNGLLRADTAASILDVKGVVTRGVSAEIG